MSILFVGAHPDDIELGCGGTVCYYNEKKYDIYCYHTTNGVYTNIKGESVRESEEILETTYKSLNSLGIKNENIFFSDTLATNLEVNKSSITELQKYILDRNVKIVFTHTDPDTYHQDHRATHNIVMASARRHINNIFLFELVFNFGGGLMIPNYYIDITKYIEKKKDALRFHKPEYVKYGGEPWIDEIVNLAKYRGSQVKRKYAEAFFVMRYLKE